MSPKERLGENYGRHDKIIIMHFDRSLPQSLSRKNRIK